MQVIRTSCISLIFVCFVLNFGHNTKATPLPLTPDGIASNAQTVSGSGIVTQQQKSMMSLLKADKLDLAAAAVAEGSAEANFEMQAVANEENAGSRQTRQVIYPYGGVYGRYYSGYPYYYPYSTYTYRPYYYYKPIYSYGLPFYLYG